MDRLLNVTSVLSVILLVIVLVSVRRAHIRAEYSVSWLGVALTLLLTLVALALRFYRPPTHHLPPGGI